MANDKRQANAGEEGNVVEEAAEAAAGDTRTNNESHEVQLPDASDAKGKDRPRRRRRRNEAPVASSDDPDVSENDETISGHEVIDLSSSGDAEESSDADKSSDSDKETSARSDGGRNQKPKKKAGGSDGAGRKQKQKKSRNQNSRKRGRNKNKKQSGKGNKEKGKDQRTEPFEGMLELIGDKKFGFIREVTTSLVKGDNDPFMPPPVIQKKNLRDGVVLKGTIKPGRKGAWQVNEVEQVMDIPVKEWEETSDFDDGLVIYPEEKLNLVTGSSDVSMRVIDLVSPIGKGQRALIVSPPRAGKTVLLKQIAAGIHQNHPDVKLVALLVDERPEEVTDFVRNTACKVFASSNDFGEDNHVRVATLAFEYSRRLVEKGEDVVVLLDSLTRLGRTFNLWGKNSGRTMSGGLDARALVMPRKIFGSARNIEGGGSLTIIATALVETGSRMDDVIFEEFKGTGNSEIVLDRELSEKRIYPAISIRKSGTRNEERLVPEEHLRQRNMLLRALNSRHPVEAMEALIKQIQTSPTNAHLLNELIPEETY